ncbi:MAG: hypothetical protein NTX72_04875 [Candidatus Uhrbacteria bacterium]|nr:hypothetical protein [Candidatus Uhrbacteria bacterium]
MRALIKMIGILLLMSVFGCNNAEAIKQARLDQAHIDLLQQTNEKLVEDLKFEKARADNAETKLALCNKPAVDPSDAITQTARASVKRLTPGADATLCVSTWSNATTHIELFVCKTPTENEPQCSARVVRTMDGHGDRLISQTNIDCERYAEMVAVIAKK